MYAWFLNFLFDYLIYCVGFVFGGGGWGLSDLAWRGTISLLVCLVKSLYFLGVVFLGFRFWRAYVWIYCVGLVSFTCCEFSNRTSVILAFVLNLEKEF